MTEPTMCAPTVTDTHAVLCCASVVRKSIGATKKKVKYNNNNDKLFSGFGIYKYG